MGRSKSTLFLMEQLVVIAVFAICAAVCVYILARSYLMTVEAVDSRHALLIAENAAEMYKAFDGDVAQVLQAKFDVPRYPLPEGSFELFYCENWLPVNSLETAEFVLHMQQNPVYMRVQTADITVSRVERIYYVFHGETVNIGQELVNLTVGIRRV